MKKLKKNEIFSLGEDMNVAVPFGAMSQKPGNIETSITKDLLEGNSLFPIMSDKEFNMGTVRYDTPHLKKHKAKTFIVSMLPVTLQPTFKALFEERFPEYAPDGHGSIIFKGSTYLENVFYKQIETLTSANQFPDILITTDINSIYHRTSRLLNDRNFDTFNYPVHPIFAGTKIEHPYKLFRFLAAEALVLVVDKSKYDTTQLPREWYELLNPLLEKSIVFCGDRDFHCNTIFSHFVKDFGYDAVKQLTKNTLIRIHPEEMLLSINGGNKINASVYVMPYSYAKNICNQIDFQIIWPEDGAILIPIQMLVKKGAAEKHKEVIRFLTGTDMGKLFEEHGLIATNAKVKNQLPSNKLNWIGWNFLKQIDLRTMKEEVRKLL